MAYSTTIPQASQRINDTTTPIRDNFAAIKTLIDVNHGTFGAADEGKHKYISMPVQSPAPGTANGEMALYTKTSALTNVPELFIRRQSNGDEIEFTSAGNANQGWTRLPSGILLIWDEITTPNKNSGETFEIGFPNAADFPVFNAVYNIQITPFFDSGDPNSAYYPGTVLIGTPGSFMVRQQARAAGSQVNVNIFSYLAIGV